MNDISLCSWLLYAVRGYKWYFHWNKSIKIRPSLIIIKYTCFAIVSLSLAHAVRIQAGELYEQIIKHMGMWNLLRARNVQFMRLNRSDNSHLHICQWKQLIYITLERINKRIEIAKRFQHLHWKQVQPNGIFWCCSVWPLVTFNTKVMFHLEIEHFVNMNIHQGRPEVAI